MMRSALSRMTWLPEILTGAALVAAPFVLTEVGASADLLSRILIWGLFGLGFDLLFGYTGLLSFGQSAFFGTGGFFAAYLLTGNIVSSVLLALLIGTVAAAVVGFGIGLAALRRTGIYFAMITLAFAEMFFFLENSPLSAWTGGENGLPGVPSPVFKLGFTTLRITSGWPMYSFLAVCFFGGFVIARRIVLSPVGHIFMAIRDNPLRARAVGHAVHRYKLASFVIAAAYAGFAGGLLGVLQGYMPPDAFQFDTSGQLVMQTVIGGAGTLYGPLVGAAVWLYLRNVLQHTFGLGPAWRLALGIIFVLLVVVLRRGIVGGIQVLWRRRRRHAERAAPEEREPAKAHAHAAAPRAAGIGAAAPTGAVILETRGISKHYGGLVANSDISIAVREGELRGVIGPNGAGKSTFFKMLTGEVKPSAGRILFGGRDITDLDVTSVCQLGVTKSYQINQLFPKLTVRENLLIPALAESRGAFRLDLLRPMRSVPGLEAQVAETLALVDLEHRADTPVDALAYGEKRRLEIGLALATSPKVLLLDEPLAGMSRQERSDTMKLLRRLREGRTLVIVEHDMEAIFDLAERITVLCEGKMLAEGAPAEIQRNSFVQDAYLGGIHAA